jgi:hypothetical protein
MISTAIAIIQVFNPMRFITPLSSKWFCLTSLLQNLDFRFFQAPLDTNPEAQSTGGFSLVDVLTASQTLVKQIHRFRRTPMIRTAPISPLRRLQ